MTERFELLEQLGRGGMGTVWKARDAGTGEFVALKLLHQMYVDDPDYLARFEREVEIAKRIDSPYVVKTIGYGKREAVPYVAMEYVGGKSLREKLKNGGPLGWDEARRIAIQLTSALQAAHTAGVIHRDIKPSNVLLDDEGNVKLADFGISRATDLTRMTGSVTVLGTPAYMSPDGEANEQSDLYALGCVLFEMLTGAPPFEGESQQQVLLKHIRESPNLLRLPSSSRRIVGWLLEKDPKRRPASAEALLAVLQGSSIRGTGQVVPPRSARSRDRWVAAGVMGVAGLGLVGVVAFAAAFLGGDGGGDPADPGQESTTNTPSAAPGDSTPTPSRAASQTATKTSTATPRIPAPTTPTPAPPQKPAIPDVSVAQEAGWITITWKVAPGGIESFTVHHWRLVYGQTVPEAETHLPASARKAEFPAEGGTVHCFTVEAVGGGSGNSTETPQHCITVSDVSP